MRRSRDEEPVATAPLPDAHGPHHVECDFHLDTICAPLFAARRRGRTSRCAVSISTEPHGRRYLCARGIHTDVSKLHFELVPGSVQISSFRAPIRSAAAEADEGEEGKDASEVLSSLVLILDVSSDTKMYVFINSPARGDLLWKLATELDAYRPEDSVGFLERAERGRMRGTVADKAGSQ